MFTAGLSEHVSSDLPWLLGPFLGFWHTTTEFLDESQYHCDFARAESSLTVGSLWERENLSCICCSGIYMMEAVRFATGHSNQEAAQFVS